MDGAEIDRWSMRYPLATAGVCITQATFITSPATAAQNESDIPGEFFHARATL